MTSMGIEPRADDRTTIERNTAIARRWMEMVSEHDVEGMCALTAPTWTMRGGPPALPAGHEGLRALFATFGPIEQTWTIEAMVAEGDLVAVRATNTCRQERFLGVPSHGRVQRFTAMFMHRIVDGLVVETHRNADDLGRLLQLGARVLPPDAPTAA